MMRRSRTCRRSASVAVAGLSPSIAENSRPPMKRAEGTASPKALTLTSVSRRSSSSTGCSADRHRDDPGAGRNDGEGPLLGQEMRQQGGVRVVNAADHPAVAPQAGRPRDFGTHRSEEVRGFPKRRQQPPPARLVDERRVASRPSGSRDRYGHRATSVRPRRRRSAGRSSTAGRSAAIARGRRIPDSASRARRAGRRH